MIFKKIEKIEEHVYEVEVMTIVFKDDMNLKLVADAIFTYDADDYSNEDKVVGDNTVAIMFPFIRSQITLMTSQPRMQPIVLPPINATKLK